LPYAYGNARDCPVCDGEVIETNITPIYDISMVVTILMM